MTKIKICGLTRKEDIKYINKYHPDYIGFVFALSKRQVSDNQAKELKALVNDDINVVGVFVDDDINHIITLVQQHIIDIVQLHGNEDEQYIELLKQHIDVPIIKAIKVINEDSLKVNYNVDYYLLDNKVSGSGQSFDWSLIKQLNKPFFLAGGINLNNLDEALNQQAYGIDLSSGVETNGIKDEAKIKEVIRRIRND